MKQLFVLIGILLSISGFSQMIVQRGGHLTSTKIVKIDSTNRVDTLPSKSGVFAMISDITSPLTASGTLDFSSTAAQTSSELTIAVTGATVGMVATVNSRTVNPVNSNWTAYVSASDVVTVRFNNYSSGAVDPASGTFSVRVIP